jgi:TRAP-type uncharacterized transport system fused permease subunit
VTANEPVAIASEPAAVSEEALLRAEQYVEEEEGAANKLKGVLGGFVRLVAFVMAAFHLWSAYAIVPTQVLRPVHVAFVLFLCFLVFPVAPRFRHRVMWWDWLAALLAVAVVVYSIIGGDDFTDRNTSPLPWDIAFGVALIVLVLEAMRRTSGWIMPRSRSASSPTPSPARTCRRRGRTRATRSAA